MVIANPIYDVVFKRLMENEKAAKFFVGTLLDETVELLEIKPQEYTYQGELDYNNPADVAKLEKRIRERYTIWVYRLDFVATIKTAEGEYKKVLIEIQKANNLVDLMRFRNYLAEQYKKEDMVNGVKTVLPITTIYILGFNLPEIPTPCMKVERNYKDLISKTTILAKSEFIENLTHDSFVVQVNRVTDRYQTRLDKLLSIFEQRHFVDDARTVKNYKHDPDLEEVKIITGILHYTGTEPEERKKIENEAEAWRTINAMLENERNKFAQALKAFEENKKAFEENKKAFEENKKELEENKKALDENKKVLEENKKALDENKKVLEEKEKMNQDLQRQLEELKKQPGTRK